MSLEKSEQLSIKDINFSKTRFRTYFGNIGEMITEEVLSKEGYQICELRPFSTGKTRLTIGSGLWNCLSVLYQGKPEETKLRSGYRAKYVPPPKFLKPSEVPTWEEYYSKHLRLFEESTNDLNSFFGDKLANFVNYIESIGIVGKEGIVGASRIQIETKSKHVYTPDLVAKKKGEIFIVEVKTNSGNIYLKPEKVQGLLSARKFGLIPLIVHINVGIKASDFSMSELM